MSQVPDALAQFDVEVIYFEPVTKNLLYTLPNKFFESIQGRLAVVSGPSPELVRFISKFKLGASSSGWGVEQLSSMISGLDRNKVEVMRKNSHLASFELNSKIESGKLKKIWQELVT